MKVDRCARHRRAARALIVATTTAMLVTTIAPLSAAADAGDLDPTFRGGALTRLAAGSLYLDGFPTDLTVQSDGDLVLTAANSSLNGGGILTRFRADGRVDKTFGQSGSTTISSGFSRFLAVSVVRRGRKNVLAGALQVVTGNPLMVLPTVGRHLEDGRPDSSFGDRGRRVLSMTPGLAYSVAGGLDGTIFVAGTMESDIFVAKLDENGDLIQSFGDQGIRRITTSAAVNLFSPVRLVMMSEGRAVITFSDEVASEVVTRVVRLTSSGDIDAEFGSATGVVLDSVSGVEASVAIMRDAAHLFVVSTGDSKAVVSALKPAKGGLDPAWGSAGKRTIALGGGNYAGDALLDAAGRVVVAAAATAGNSVVWGVTRLRPGGSLDTSFSGDGKAVLDIGLTGTPIAVVQVDDGYAVGGVLDGKPAIMKIDRTGASVKDFGGRGTGVAYMNPRFRSGLGNDVVVDSAQRSIVAGSVYRTSVLRDAALWRLRADGRIDGTFGKSGVVIARVKGRSLTANEVTELSDGRHLVAMTMSDSNRSWLVLARYTSSGIPDTSFGPKGRRVIAAATLNPSTQRVRLTVDAQGRYLVGADVSGNGFTMARVRPNGQLDTSFGTGGLVVVPPPVSGQTSITALRITDTGRIVVADTAGLRMMRWLANGSPDTSFGAGGVQPILLDSSFASGAAAFTPTLGLVVAASPFSGPGLKVGRVGATGLPDDAFGTDGVKTVALANDRRMLVSEIVVRPNGSMLMVGARANDAFDITSARGFVVRLTASGALDSTFSSDGLAPVMPGDQVPSFVSAMAVRGSKVVVLGNVIDVPPFTYVARLLL